MSKIYGPNLMRYKDPEKRLAWQREWKRTHRQNVRESNYRRNVRLKHEALTHYGKNGECICCWPECFIADPDMLTLDHVANDGASHRKGRGKGMTGADMYGKLANAGWPEGFQTLCWNHQWKKEIIRRREARARGLELEATCSN